MQTEVDPGSWISTGDRRFDAPTGYPAGAKLATLVTGTVEPALSPWEAAEENCGRVKFHSGIEFTPVVTGIGGYCVPTTWFRLVVVDALCSCL